MTYPFSILMENCGSLSNQIGLAAKLKRCQPVVFLEEEDPRNSC